MKIREKKYCLFAVFSFRLLLCLSSFLFSWPPSQSQGIKDDALRFFLLSSPHNVLAVNFFFPGPYKNRTRIIKIFSLMGFAPGPCRQTRRCRHERTHCTLFSSHIPPLIWRYFQVQPLDIIPPEIQNNKTFFS